MAIENALYYFAVCDKCGEKADYGDYSAWSDPGSAADEAVAGDWTEKDGVFLCPECLPRDADPAECGPGCPHGCEDATECIAETARA